MDSCMKRGAWVSQTSFSVVGHAPCTSGPGRVRAEHQRPLEEANQNQTKPPSTRRRRKRKKKNGSLRGKRQTNHQPPAKARPIYLTAHSTAPLPPSRAKTHNFLGRRCPAYCANPIFALRVSHPAHPPNHLHLKTCKPQNVNKNCLWCPRTTRLRHHERDRHLHPRLRQSSPRSWG